MRIDTRVSPCPTCGGEIKYPDVAFPRNITTCGKCGGEFTVWQLRDWSVPSSSELVNADGKCSHCQKQIEGALAHMAAHHHVCYICECGAFYGRRTGSPDWYYEGRLKAGSTTANPETQIDPWPEERVDIIGQNGNNGEHYAERSADENVPISKRVADALHTEMLRIKPTHSLYTNLELAAENVKWDAVFDLRDLANAARNVGVEVKFESLSDDPLPGYVLKDPGGYTELANVLQAAFNQAAYGKGAERHANSKPFVEQPILKLCQMYGAGFAFGQAGKKMEEAQRMDKDAAVRELLGAIVYIAAAAIHIEQGGDDA